MNEIHTINIGQLRCTIFRDMMFSYLAKDFFMNAAPEEAALALKRYTTSPGNIPSPFIALLVEDGNNKILIDTGAGFFEEGLLFRGNTYLFRGKLQEQLNEMNIQKEDITDVVITHFHPDHIGSNYTPAGEPNFPNARFHMHEDEWNYWHSPASVNQPPLFHYFIETNITPLKNADLQLCRGDHAELLPGISAVKAPGHTPGQIAVDIHSDNEHLLYISDAWLHPLHIEKLDWQTNYDLDHQKARQSRVQLLEMAYEENMLVQAFHFDFPGLGRVDKFEQHWIWTYS